MKEIREEAERNRKEKLEKYGCGGRTHRAHGGKVEEHPHEKKDLHLIKELEHDHEPKKHRADGGIIAGGDGSSRLGRGRHKGGKGGKTNVNIMVGKPGGDAGSPLPPALGAGPSPAGPAALPPRPALPMPPAGPRPMPAPGGAPGMPPMKRGGKVEGKHEKKHEGRHHEARHHEKHSRHSGHRG